MPHKTRFGSLEHFEKGGVEVPNWPPTVIKAAGHH